MKVIVLQEGSRPNEVGYHFTNLEGLASILNSNKMIATNQPVRFDKVEQMWEPTDEEYADYSKSWSYTRKKDGMYFRRNNLKDSVRITFDIDKISERQRVFPFSWRWAKNEEKFEYEERVEGDTYNIKDYIKEIVFSPALNFTEKSYYEISKKSSKKEVADMLSLIDRFEYVQGDVRRYNNSKNKYDSKLFAKMDNLITKDTVSEDEVFSEFINIYSKCNSLSDFGEEVSNYCYAREVKNKDGADEVYADLSKFKQFTFEDIFSKKSTKTRKTIYDKFLDNLSFDFQKFIDEKNIKISYLGSKIDTTHFSEMSKDIQVFSKKEADSFLKAINKRFEEVQNEMKETAEKIKKLEAEFE